MILRPYPLCLSSDFTPSDKAAITAACLRVGAKLARYTGLSAWRSVEKVFAGLDFRPNPNLTDYNGRAYPLGLVIDLVPGKVTVPLVIHELGHAFNDRQSRRQRPYKVMQRDYIRGWDGRRVPGRGATANGFRSDDYDYRQHPMFREADKGEPFSYLEDFCDMFMCWVLNTLADNSAGDARRAWMDEHVKEWVG